MEEVRDVLVIGGGPVGLFGLYCAGLHHLKATMLERLDRLGGQLEHLYPEKPIYDVGGFPRTTGRELVERLKEQAFQYPAEIVTGITAQSLRRVGDVWEVGTDRGRYLAHVVIITAGIGEFIPRRFQNPAIDSYEGHGLYYIVKRLADFDGRRVLIVGGGDSAADWAMALSGRAARVTMIHRRQNFQCHVDSLAKLQKDPRVSLVPNTELVNVKGDGQVEGVTLWRKDTDTREELPLDAVIVAIGLLPGTDLFRQWGLLMEDGEIRVDTTMATNLPGVYAAGDIATYPGKVKLIAAGFGEVATAVQAGYRYLADQTDRPHG